jgi:hypothetical protein
VWNFKLKIYTIDFKIIEYLIIESKLQLSPIGGAKQNPIRKWRPLKNLSYFD